MLTGWQRIENKLYYFAQPGDMTHPEGALYVSEITPDGYNVDKDGCRITKKAENAQRAKSIFIMF